MKLWNNAKMINGAMALLLGVSMILSPMSGTVRAAGVETDTTTLSNDLRTQNNTDNLENTNIDPNGTLGKNSDVGIEVTKSIKGVIGKEIKIEFKLKSSNPETIIVKNVYPIIDTTFPFETSGDAYKNISTNGDVNLQKELPAEYNMTTRSDLEQGYHSIRFIGEYAKVAADGTVSDFYVIKTINIYFSATSEDSSPSKPSKPSKDNDDSSDSSDDYDGGSTGGGYDGGGYSGGSDGEVSAPKLVITGYDTNPKKIKAGETFKLTIHIQNTSKTTSVCNGKFLVGNEAGTFLPTSGSSAIFVEKIPAGEIGDLEIEMKTSADLAQKNYMLVVKGDFDDGNGNAFTSSDNLTIPVYQDVKLSVSDASMSPEALGIGMTGNLMFTINNQGNAGVYNVSVAAKDDAVNAEESYVGNIAGASSAYASLNVTGVQDNSSTGMITVVIKYEDAEGNKEEIESSVSCLVGEDVQDTFGDGFEEFEYEEEESSFPWWIVIVIVVVLAVAGAVVAFVIIKKKKQKEMLEAEEDDEDDEEFMSFSGDEEA